MTNEAVRAVSARSPAPAGSRRAAGSGSSRSRHDHDEARSAFEETRTLALERGNAYDAALVSLDLARVHLDRLDLDALREEAKAIIPVLAAEGLHEEAGAALPLYRDTLLTGRLEQEFLNRLARYLEAARRDPGLRFKRATASN